MPQLIFIVIFCLLTLFPFLFLFSIIYPFVQELSISSMNFAFLLQYIKLIQTIKKYFSNKK